MLGFGLGLGLGFRIEGLWFRAMVRDRVRVRV